MALQQLSQETNLLILVLQLVSFLQVRLLGGIREAVPHLTELLGHISNAKTGVLGLDFGPMLRAEDKEP